MQTYDNDNKTYYYCYSLAIICPTIPHHCQGASALLRQFDTEYGLMGQDLIRQS
jgi:hypothetical protein